MTIRPIIFSTTMVTALLAGRKSQTRRLSTSPLRRVEVGDLLYVREAWRAEGEDADDDIASATSTCTGPQDIMFRASASEVEFALFKFRPSIHMPRWASRLTLEVTRVRHDRLQRISREDCQAEGHPQCPEISPDPEVHLDAAHDWFMDLWDTLHDKPGERWTDNPMIVAVTFTVHRANVDQVAAGKALA